MPSAKAERTEVTRSSLPLRTTADLASPSSQPHWADLSHAHSFFQRDLLAYESEGKDYRDVELELIGSLSVCRTVNRLYLI